MKRALLTADVKAEEKMAAAAAGYGGTYKTISSVVLPLLCFLVRVTWNYGERISFLSKSIRKARFSMTQSGVQVVQDP
jgi:hypothetical protein